MVGSAVAIDQDYNFVEAGHMSQVLHTDAVEELPSGFLPERLPEIVDIVGWLELLHLSGIQRAGHLGQKVGRWDCKTCLNLI